MTPRKQLIDEIMANFQAMKNKMHAQVGAHSSKLGITHSQLFVLAIIEKNQNIGIKEISRKLNITSSASTQLVDGLVAKGYVIRKSSSKDRRALHLSLSPQGRSHIADMKKKRMKMMMKFFDPLNDEELATYLALYKKIVTSIKK